MDHSIQVRMLEGAYIPFTEQEKLANGSISSTEIPSFITLYHYLKNLTKQLPKKNKLIISVASMTACLPGVANCHYNQNPYFSFSWNHGKAIIIDNKDLITGGQNLNADSYLGKNPVNDSMLELVGPIAQTAEKYADTLWKYVGTHQRGKLENHCYTYENRKINDTCLLTISSLNSNLLPNKVNPNLLPIIVRAMSVAKLNHGVLPDDADQSEIARVYAFKNAEKTIKISQQALFFKIPVVGAFSPWETIDGNVISALAYAIYVNNVDVKIITSNFQGTSITGWTSFVSLEYIYNSIKNSIKSQFPSASDIELSAKLNKLLHLAYIDSNASNNISIRNHNKFWMVDNHIFYFGSHNIYPSSLQQYGIIVDNKFLAKNILINFWDPMWKNSDKEY
jgi:phosphatidylserine/phosphatidylglycerophosphate/cardiolipin synthase-like enzyme